MLLDNARLLFVFGVAFVFVGVLGCLWFCWLLVVFFVAVNRQLSTHASNGTDKRVYRVVLICTTQSLSYSRREI